MLLININRNHEIQHANFIILLTSIMLACVKKPINEQKATYRNEYTKRSKQNTKLFTRHHSRFQIMNKRAHARHDHRLSQYGIVSYTDIEISKITSRML